MIQLRDNNKSSTFDDALIFPDEQKYRSSQDIFDQMQDELCPLINRSMVFQLQRMKHEQVKEEIKRGYSEQPEIHYTYKQKQELLEQKLKEDEVYLPEIPMNNLLEDESILDSIPDNKKEEQSCIKESQKVIKKEQSQATMKYDSQRAQSFFNVKKKAMITPAKIDLTSFSIDFGKKGKKSKLKAKIVSEGKCKKKKNENKIIDIQDKEEEQEEDSSDDCDDNNDSDDDYKIKKSKSKGKKSKGKAKGKGKGIKKVNKVNEKNKKRK